MKISSWSMQKKVIEDSKKKLREDSIAIDNKMRLDAARYRLEQTTGEKDTLTNEERLKKAEKDFQ